MWYYAHTLYYNALVYIAIWIISIIKAPCGQKSPYYGSFSTTNYESTFEAQRLCTIPSPGILLQMRTTVLPVIHLDKTLWSTLWLFPGFPLATRIDSWTSLSPLYRLAIGNSMIYWWNCTCSGCSFCPKNLSRQSSIPHWFATLLYQRRILYIQGRLGFFLQCHGVPMALDKMGPTSPAISSLVTALIISFNRPQCARSFSYPHKTNRLDITPPNVTPLLCWSHYGKLCGWCEGYVVARSKNENRDMFCVRHFQCCSLNPPT